MRKRDKIKNIEEANRKILGESVNWEAKEDLKKQFYELEALNRLDPWDVVAVLEELRKDFLY